MASELNGKRIIVVEDDFLLASEICMDLRDLGATVLGPAPTPFYAMQLINQKRIDAAVLDVRLHGETVFDVADRLRELRVPIVFATGSRQEDLPGRFQTVPWLVKPLDKGKLLEQILDITHRPAGIESGTMPLPPPAPAQLPPVQAFARILAGRLGGTQPARR